MSYYIDVGEQDKALAEQIAKDQETLAALHQTVADTRTRTNELRQETAAQKRALDTRARVPQGGQGRAAPSSRRRSPRRSREQKAHYRGSPAQQGACRGDHPQGRRRAEAAGQTRSTTSSRKQVAAAATSRSQFNGTMRWPMPATSPRNTAAAAFACYAAGPRLRALPQGHRHRRRRTARRSRRAAAGTVVYVGWNWADGPDPAWIVIIAHAGNLKTWYAHMQPTRPGPGRRARVKRARSSATRATPAMRPARTSTGWSSSTATS